MERIPFTFTIVVLALLFSLTEQRTADETCKCFKEGCSSYTFNVISSFVNWTKSRKLCQETARGDLVSMESDEEWTFLKNAILNLTKAYEYFIGLKKGVQSGEWRWLSNKSAVNTFQNRWSQREPNGDGNCVVMSNYLKQYGKYNDLDCQKHFRRGYICECPVSSCNKELTTKPSTITKLATMQSSTSQPKARTSTGKELTTKPSLMTKPVTMQSSTSQPKGPTSTELTTKPSTITKPATMQLSTSQPKAPTSTDNCLRHNLVQTTATSPKSIASTRKRTASPTQDFTRDPEGGKQARDKDNCSSVVIILTSLVAVLSVALFILGACFVSWRKKQRKDLRNATDARDQLAIDNQERSSLSPENVARELGFSEEAEPCDTKRENQRRKTDQSSSQECGYAMLTPRAMMLSGDSSYASLVKSKQGDCISESSVAASPLLQHDDEHHDQLPTYVNACSANYANV